MNRGHYVNFKNLSNTIELKELNSVLNDMLRIMWEKLDIGNPYKTYVFTGTVQCEAGASVAVDYDVTFEDIPTVIAYSTNGNGVILDSELNGKNGTSVRFADLNANGIINILATGKIKA